jgi:hypothetical protein
MTLSSWSGSQLSHQPGAQPNQETCIANISPRERQKRLIGGIVELVVGVAILALLVRLGVNPWWRLGLFIPFFGAGVGFFQWRDKT